MRGVALPEMLIIGLIILVIVIIVRALSPKKVRPNNYSTTVVTLPDTTKMVCRTCGATLTEENTSIIQGTAMIVCPKCNNIHQMTEISK